MKITFLKIKKIIIQSKTKITSIANYLEKMKYPLLINLQPLATNIILMKSLILQVKPIRIEFPHLKD